MDNTERALDNDGYRPCLVRVCGKCAGTGRYYPTRHTASNLPSGEQVACDGCMGGFQFYIPETNDFINWLALRLLKHIEVNAGGELQQAFMQAVVRATEHKMTEQPRWNCDCTHAPEQHGVSGCMASGLMSGPCTCRHQVKIPL